MESETRSFVEQYVVEDKAGLEYAFSNCSQEYLNDFKKFELESDCKEFFQKDDQKFAQEFPNLNRILAVLRVVHSALDSVLLLKEKGRFSKEADTAKKLLEETKKAFRKLWNDGPNPKVDILMIQCIRVINYICKQESNLLPIFFFSMAILSLIIKELIHIIENSSKQDLLKYEMWTEKAKMELLNIARDPIFQAVLATAASSGIVIVGANVGLAALGFTATGIQAGSIAAAWMSMLGTVSQGSLFAALQSAGAVGIGGLATGGLAIVGGVVGLGIFAVVKLVTMEFTVTTKAVVQGKSGKLNEMEIKYSNKMELRYFLLETIPEETKIPYNVSEIVVFLSRNNKKMPITKKMLDETAESAIGSFSLFLCEKGKENFAEAPLFLKRKYKGCWEIKQNLENNLWD